MGSDTPPDGRASALGLLQVYCQELIPFEGDFLVGMHSRFPSNGNAEKAMRWLGFMQGVLFAKGYYAIEELKSHTRDWLK